VSVDDWGGGGGGGGPELLKKRVLEKSRHSKTVQAKTYLFMSTYIVLVIDY